MGSVLGIFVGSASSFNIIRATSHIGEALSKEFTADLVTTEPKIAAEVDMVYDEIHGTSEQSSTQGEISALNSYIRTRDPDVLFQITSPPIHGTIVGSLAWLHSISFVYRYSGDRFYEYNISQGFNKIIHFGLNNVVGQVPLSLADACVALGPTGRERLVRRGVPEESIRIIPPIVDESQFSATGPQIEFDTDKHIGLFVGRVSREKGKEIIERTLPEILDRRPDLQFVFIGERVENLAISPRYKSSITLIGPVAPETVPQYYRAASFVIHPSLSEGLPRAVLEANAMGVPTIARSVGDIDYVTDNTFTTESGFVNLVCNFESLQPDSITRFRYNNVKSEYTCLFNAIT